jgi:hypothetical protein
VSIKQCKHIVETRSAQILSARSSGRLMFIWWSRYFSTAGRLLRITFLASRICTWFIIIITKFMKDWVSFLFPDPQNEIGPSISSSVVLCSFVLLVYIVTLVLLFYSCPSSVRVVATFPGTVLFPLLYSVLPFFP